MLNGRINMTNLIEHNANDLNKELMWFSEILDTRINLHLGNVVKHANITGITPPDFSKSKSMYANFSRYYKLSFAERILLMLSIIPHIRPALLDAFYQHKNENGRGFTEFGGLQGKQHGGFLPTGETFLFIISGSNLQRRFSLYPIFNADHFFAKHNIIKLDHAPDGEPVYSGAIRLSQDMLEYFTVGQLQKPDLSSRFPAKLITTRLEWNDLILPKNTLNQIEEIKTWLAHEHTLMKDWGFEKKFRKGFRCMFYGPPGTGKSLTACLLGKHINRDVYRIDLSLVVSKYIGETEKNLSKVFNQAENKNWILFFDEADALFGKRTKVSDAHDRYANQEVSYLLQRIEDFDGIILLASNMKENMDESFTRRFESIIHFPLPRPKERQKLWKNGFSDQSKLDSKVDIKEIAEDYEMAGGSIMNAIRYSSLMALKNNTNVLSKEYILDGIRKEHEKEGRSM